MKFSIVTPAFNAEKYLPEMLKSVRDQSYPDWELIIVDDGSSDSTPDIIKKATQEDIRIKAFCLAENSGSDFAPRRLAFEKSSGDFIVNIDADDFVDSDYLLRFHRMIQNTRADLVYADMYIGEDFNQYKKFITKGEDLYGTIFKGKDLFSLTLTDWNISGVSATSKDLVFKSLEAFDRMLASEKEWNSFDNENLTRLDLFLAERVTFCKAKYYYRQQKDSVTHKIDIRRFSILKSDLNLCRFTDDKFGETSEEYALAQAQLFTHTIELIRLYNAYSEFKKDKIVCNILREAFAAIRRDLIKGHVAPRYLMLSRLGFTVTSLVMKLYGR